MYNNGFGNCGLLNGINNRFEIMNELLLLSIINNMVIILVIFDINNVVCWFIKCGIVKILIV